MGTRALELFALVVLNSSIGYCGLFFLDVSSGPCFPKSMCPDEGQFSFHFTERSWRTDMGRQGVRYKHKHARACLVHLKRRGEEGKTLKCLTACWIHINNLTVSSVLTFCSMLHEASVAALLRREGQTKKVVDSFHREGNKTHLWLAPYSTNSCILKWAHF